MPTHPEWPNRPVQKPGEPPPEEPVEGVRSAMRQEEIERGVGTYSANLLPQREGLVNWMQTV